MKLRRGGMVVDADGKWHPRTLDMGPGRARLTGSMGDGGIPGISTIREPDTSQVCPKCKAITIVGELRRHMRERHGEAA